MIWTFCDKIDRYRTAKKRLDRPSTEDLVTGQQSSQ
jgi:hypothetical protein